jgi:hypothetical protein
MESVMSTIIDVFHKYINKRKKVIATRAAITILFFLFGLTMVTRVALEIVIIDFKALIFIAIFLLKINSMMISQGGLFVLNLIDSFIAGYPLILVGLLEVIAVPWIYGTLSFILIYINY